MEYRIYLEESGEETPLPSLEVLQDESIEGGQEDVEATEEPVFSDADTETPVQTVTEYISLGLSDEDRALIESYHLESAALQQNQVTVQYATAFMLAILIFIQAFKLFFRRG